MTQIIIFIIVFAILLIAGFFYMHNYVKAAEKQKLAEAVSALQTYGGTYLTNNKSHTYKGIKGCYFDKSFEPLIFVPSETMTTDKWIELDEDTTDCSFKFESTTFGDDNLRFIVQVTSDGKIMALKAIWKDEVDENGEAGSNGVPDIEDLYPGKNYKKEIEDYFKMLSDFNL